MNKCSLRILCTWATFQLIWPFLKQDGRCAFSNKITRLQLFKRLAHPLFLFYTGSILFIFHNYAKYLSWLDGSPFRYDAGIYYYYLDAAFIKNDITFEFPQNENYGLETTPLGKKIPRMTMGVALLQLPWFLVAHHIAASNGYDQDGYSPPYKWVLHIGLIVYVLAALWFLYKALLHYFNRWISLAVIALIFYGTNLFYYSVGFNQMSHGYLFCIHCLNIYFLVKWLRSRRMSYLASSFFCIGLATLVRPTDALMLILPLLLGVFSFEGLRDRILFYRKNWHYLPFLGFLFFLPLIPQMLYWRMQTGQFLFYSYKDERFFFADPKFFESLFSYNKGLIPYSPVLFFSLVGFLFLFFRHRELFYGILIFTILNIYVLSSWWSWTYGGGLGARQFIQSYALLAFPMAAVPQFLLDKIKPIWPKRLILGAMAVLAAMLIKLNLLMTWQYKLTMIHWNAMTKEAYWLAFGRERFSEDDWVKQQRLLREPDAEAMKKGHRDID
jgi:hypothetical protein